MASEIAVKCLSLKLNGETNSLFWKSFPNEEILKNTIIDTKNASKMLENCNFDVIICAFDKNFPTLPENLKLGERPYLLAFKGNISLLKNDKKVAVVGTLFPTEEIKEREAKIVQNLIKNETVIVSGHAKGCDTVAHKKTVEFGGKTIAILPTPLSCIYPKENSSLAEKMATNGNLILTEFVTEAKSKTEKIRRFIERDRLQAMFSNSVVLIASYRQGEGDSGSRHAMQKALEYHINRYVMFNEKTDFGKAIFGLNQDLIQSGVPFLTKKNLEKFF